MTGDELVRAVNTTLMPGFAGADLPDWLARELDEGLGSVCLFATNVVDAGQLLRLTTAIHEHNPDAIIAIDEEGGDVTRLHHATGSPHPGAAHLGRIGSPAFTERVAAHIGAELAALGVDLNLAPVADVNSNPRNPVIGVRSFGSDPMLVAEQVAAYTRGLQSSGVAACAKHFPGHGDTSADSHVELPTITVDAGTLAERELVPFRAAVEADVLAVMTSHILVPAIDPDLPATLSAPVLDLLRTDLHFTGVIVSDALDMAGASASRGIPEAAVLALAAGCELLCIGTDNTAGQLAEIRAHVLDAVASGRLGAERVFAAAERVSSLNSAVASARGTDPGAAPHLDGSGLAVTRPVPALVSPLLLRLDSPANIAAGTDTPWGLGEYLRPELDELLPGATCVRASDLAGVRDALSAARQRPLVVQGRDLARVPFLGEAVAAVRAARPDAVIVESGWPAPNSVPSFDIASYGSSRAISVCLVRLLAQGSR